MADCKNEITDICNRWCDDAYTAKKSEIPNVLYHYTDAAGLSGMLRNASVWATETRFLNDSEELRHALAAAKSYVEAELGKLAKEDLQRPFFEAVRKYQNIASTLRYYIFSLSAERDDLSQWRGYAREGQGYTIGFGGQLLLNKSLSQVPGASGAMERPFGMAKVEYESGTQSKIIGDVMTEIRGALKKGLSGSESDAEALCDWAGSRFDAVMEVRAAVNKHASFRAEHEWRLVSQVAQEDPAGEVKVRVSGQKLVRYVELDLKDEDGQLPIVEIGIGPGFAGDEHIDAVGSLCRAAGLPDTVKIYCAQTPYRRT